MRPRPSRGRRRSSSAARARSSSARRRRRRGGGGPGAGHDGFHRCLRRRLFSFSCVYAIDHDAAEGRRRRRRSKNPRRLGRDPTPIYDAVVERSPSRRWSRRRRCRQAARRCDDDGPARRPGGSPASRPSPRESTAAKTCASTTHVRRATTWRRHSTARDAGSTISRDAWCA